MFENHHFRELTYKQNIRLLDIALFIRCLNINELFT